MTNVKRSKLSPILWQILASVLIGLSVGALLISLTERKPAQASYGPVGKCSYEAQTLSLKALDLFPSLDRNLNVLVLGVDSNGPGTQRFTGTRSDTMILVSLDPANNKVAALSIPRDTKVDLGSRCSGCDKINAAHALGGPQLAVKTVQEFLGVPIDHYIVIDTQGLKYLLQELGPIPVLVEKPMHYVDHTAHLSVNLEPGLQLLDVAQAEGYIRYRHDANGDIGRIERQQWLLRQLGQKLADPQVLFKLPQLFQFADQYVITDLSFEDMMRLGRFLKDFNTRQIETATLPGSPAYINGLSYWITDPESSRATVSRLIGNSYGGACSARDGYAGSIVSSSNLSNVDLHQEQANRPLSVIIRYPRGGESSAEYLESKLKAAGYRVKYRYLADIADCRHEQLIQKSSRANEAAKSSLTTSIAELAGWPLVVSIDSRPACDFMVVVSPTVALGANNNTGAGGLSGNNGSVNTVPAVAAKVQRYL